MTFPKGTGKLLPHDPSFSNSLLAATNKDSIHQPCLVRISNDLDWFSCIQFLVKDSVNQLVFDTSLCHFLTTPESPEPQSTLPSTILEVENWSEEQHLEVQDA